MTHVLKFEKLNESALHNIAHLCASALTAQACYLLHGEMGVGKTSFSRAFIQAAAEDETLNVPSPTFTILQTYTTPLDIEIHHYDLYRMDANAEETLQEEELYEIGLEESLNTACTIIEWPDRCPKALLRKEKVIDVSLKTTPDNLNLRDISLSFDKIQHPKLLDILTAHKA